MGTPSDAELIAESLGSAERFGEVFDRHAPTVYRYLARRVGPSRAADALGDVFLAAFESRGRYDRARDSALPWLYGIATNVLRKLFRDHAAELRALAALGSAPPSEDPSQRVVTAVDAAASFRELADVLTAMPAGERDALLLLAWEQLSYAEIASALEIPVGTVRSRLNRARHRLRVATDAIERMRALRPDRVSPIDEVTHEVLSRGKERMMQASDWNRPGAEEILRTPDVHPRLAYSDERAALEYLVRVFGFEEIREARTDLGDHILAFLRVGNGQFMISREDPDVHRIHSPSGLGGSSVQLQVRVHDIDSHYEKAVAEGADITMPLEDAFYGERRYEASDLEGHRWHFSESFSAIRARGGEAPDFAE